MELPGTETTSRRFLVYGVPLLAIGVLAVIALTVLGIGPFAGDTLSREEFLEQADQICSEAHDKYEEAQQEPPRAVSEYVDLHERLLDISLQEQEAIRELAPPSELEEPLEAYLAAREEAFQFLRDAVEAARDEDDKAYRQADADLEAGAAEREKLAQAVGLEVCGHTTPANSDN